MEGLNKISPKVRERFFRQIDQVELAKEQAATVIIIHQESVQQQLMIEWLGAHLRVSRIIRAAQLNIKNRCIL